MPFLAISNPGRMFPMTCFATLERGDNLAGNAGNAGNVVPAARYDSRRRQDVEAAGNRQVASEMTKVAIDARRTRTVILSQNR
jgi:hypothetical protein